MCLGQVCLEQPAAIPLVVSFRLSGARRLVYKKSCQNIGGSFATLMSNCDAFFNFVNILCRIAAMAGEQSSTIEY